MTVISVPVTFDSAARKKDRSVGMRFTSNLEISHEDFTVMDRLIFTSGWLLYRENELKEEDVPTEDAPVHEGKSKGQRLRAVYFLIWKKLKSDQDFETWYTQKFEKLMDKLKEELD